MTPAQIKRQADAWRERFVIYAERAIARGDEREANALIWYASRPRQVAERLTGAAR